MPRVPDPIQPPAASKFEASPAAPPPLGCPRRRRRGTHFLSAARGPGTVVRSEPSPVQQPPPAQRVATPGRPSCLVMPGRAQWTFTRIRTDLPPRPSSRETQIPPGVQGRDHHTPRSFGPRGRAGPLVGPQGRPGTLAE